MVVLTPRPRFNQGNDVKPTITTVPSPTADAAAEPTAAADALDDEELLRTGCVDAVLFEKLRQAYAETEGRGPAWVRQRLVPLVTRLYVGAEVKLHDPWRSAPIDVRSADEFRSWIERYFPETF